MKKSVILFSAMFSLMQVGFSQDGLFSISTSSYVPKKIDLGYYKNSSIIPSLSIGLISDSISRFGFTSGAFKYSRLSFELAETDRLISDSLVLKKSVSYLDFTLTQGWRLHVKEYSLYLSTALSFGIMVNSSNNKSTLLRNESFNSQFSEYYLGVHLGLLIEKEIKGLDFFMNPTLVRRVPHIDLAETSSLINAEVSIGIRF